MTGRSLLVLGLLTIVVGSYMPSTAAPASSQYPGPVPPTPAPPPPPAPADPPPPPPPSPSSPAPAPAPVPPSAPGSPSAPATPPTPPAAPSATPEEQQWLAQLRAEIKGRETEPAGKVFKNVTHLTEVPAGRFLNIMQMGYSRSLGVTCTHCHTEGAWQDDGMAAKRIARRMHEMTSEINTKLLPDIESFPDRDPKPSVNCTTCHRGQKKPALSLR